MMDIGGHLRGLWRFAGRERRTTFWLWMLICYGVQSAIGIVAMQPLTADLAERMQQYTATHPELGQGGRPFPIEMFTSLFPMREMLAVMALGMVVSVVLVAAAVTRRLHDTGRSGWWAAPLVVIQLGVLALLSRVVTTVSSTPTWAALSSDVWLLVGGYLVALLVFIILIVFCCQATREERNRYGPPPGERVG